MSLSHAESITAITTPQLLKQLSNSVKSLYQKTKEEAFATLEIQLHQQFAEVERQCMAKLLKQ